MNKRKFISLGLGAAIIVIGLATGGYFLTQKQETLLKTPDVKTTTTMGTTVTITSYTPNKKDVLEKGLKIAEQYDNWLSVDKEGTLIDKINEQAGIAPVSVNSEVYSLLKDAYSLSEKGTGYDVTIGPLSKLWHIGFSDAKLPTQEEINQVLPLIDYHFIKFDDNQKTVYLTQKGASLDLGSMTKGYVAKQIVSYLKKQGVKNSIVDLGSSSLYVLGDSPRGGGTAWNVGVKDPNDTSNNIGILTVKNKFISTSGIYERFLKVGDKVYPHILNPKTGYPFDNAIQSVSIVGIDNATYGDGVTTAVFALGTKQGYEYVEKAGLDAIFIDKDNRVYVTPGLKDKFTINSQSKYQLADIKNLS